MGSQAVLMWRQGGFCGTVNGKEPAAAAGAARNLVVVAVQHQQQPRLFPHRNSLLLPLPFLSLSSSLRRRSEGEAQQVLRAIFRFPSFILLHPSSSSSSSSSSALFQKKDKDEKQIRLAFAVRLRCNSNNSADMISQLELGKAAAAADDSDRKGGLRVNGVFWILLLNIGIYMFDHVLQVRQMQALYLYHALPSWYQFITATFCHGNWNHLSSNLFFVYVFGKLVEEEEGSFALWMSYLLTGVGANIISWLVLPRTAVSVGASGAVFGLFAISVLVKMRWDWRKILEVLILGQFVVKRVLEEAQASARLPGIFGGGYSNINHIAHISGAFIGVMLVWLLTRIPKPSSSQRVPRDTLGKDR